MRTALPFLMAFLVLTTGCQSESGKLQKEEDELMETSQAEAETAAYFHDMSLKIKENAPDQDTSWKAYEDSSQAHLQNSGRIIVKMVEIQKRIEELNGNK